MYVCAFAKFEVYGAVLEVCRRAGDSVRAVEYLNHMREHKLQPSANHFYLILCALRSQVIGSFNFFFIYILLAYIKILYYLFIMDFVCRVILIKCSKW